MKNKRVLGLLILTIQFALVLVSFQTGWAQTNASSFVLEKEQHYETYSVGGTCISSTSNIALADLDADGTTEIITGGYTYSVDNGTRSSLSAPLKIWSWDSQNLTLETSYKWPEIQGTSAVIVSVASGDLNQDGTTNLLTAGRTANESGTYAQLRIWTWNGSVLELKASKEWNNNQAVSTLTSAIIADANQDGTQEIITAGRTLNTATNVTDAQLMIWHWNGNQLTMQDTAEWHDGTAASANSVCIADVDNDGKAEIVTAGYNHELTNSSGQIRTWSWNGASLQPQASTEWRTIENAYALNIAGGVQGNTIVNNVKADDVDKDGVTEIITGGFTYNGQNVSAQLRVWNCTDHAFMLENSTEWSAEYLTEIKALSLNDVDADGATEIVTSGCVAAENSFIQNTTFRETAQLKTLSWNGTTLAIERSVDWTIGEGICAWNVASGDVDNDGTMEIVTVGCMFVTDLCDPDMRIWNAADAVSPISQGWQVELLVVAAISVVVIVVAGSYLLIKRFHGKESGSGEGVASSAQCMVWFQK